MRSVESFEYLDRSLAELGEYVITTANGSVYRVIVGPGGSSDLVRRREQAPRDPEYDMASNEPYGNDQTISLLDWRAFRDVRGAVFMFYAEGARRARLVISRQNGPCESTGYSGELGKRQMEVRSFEVSDQFDQSIDVQGKPPSFDEAVEQKQ